MSQELERRGGFLITFHWKARDQVALNKLADIVAGNARVAVRDLAIPGATKSLVSYAYDTHVAVDGRLDNLHRP